MRARQFAVPADVRQVALVRQVAREAALDWGVPETTADDAVQVVSELATDAIQNATSSLRVGLLLADDVLRVEVYDDLPAGPSARAGRVEAAGGPGEQLVEGLTRNRGAQQHGDGTCVWAEVPCQRGQAGSEHALTG